MAERYLGNNICYCHHLLYFAIIYFSPLKLLVYIPYITRGKMRDSLILAAILQKMTVLKQMRYLASSLVETSSTWNSSLPVTSSIKKSMHGSTTWHSGVEKFEPLELVSCRDELHKIFKFSYLWRKRAH